jgi:cyclophilin family peptidyl-prolyl cis-trans isomerase
MGARRTVAIAILALAILATAAGSLAAESSLSVRIEVKGRYYRAGEPVEVRVVLENPGEEPIPNAEGTPIVGNLELILEEGNKNAESQPEFDAATQPRVFAPGSSITQVIDLVPYFPALAHAGEYQLRYKAGETESEAIDLSLAPPYNDDLDYTATLITEHGEITFELLKDAAPDHVRNFVDLSRRGFYADTLFHVVAKGEMIVGGDKTGDGSGGTDYFLEPEMSNLPHERGTLSAVRTVGYDNGSQFFIGLRRSPQRDGKFTVFGKLIAGEQALAALENVPTSGQTTQPFFKPLEDARLIQVRIKGHGATEEAPAGAEPAPSN